MTPENPIGEPSPADAREERLGELINDFFDRRQRGEAITPDEFLAQHQEYADELREHLSGLELLDDLRSASGVNTLSGKRPSQYRGSSAERSAKDSSTPLPEIEGYEIIKQIGRGGMGVVFRAVQTSTKRLVALKVLLEGPLSSDNARKRFEREIALAAQLRHPNIIPIYDSGTCDGRMFYAMEHVFGLSLGDHFRAHESDIPAKLRLFVKICQAVSHAHQKGIIHRDLKPSNILVDGTGEPHVVDFGLAKAGSLGDVTTSITAQIVGTLAYMSPEQASGDPDAIDVRTDVYSLGVVLYEILTGRLPYETNLSMGKILHNIAQAEPPIPSKINSKLDGEISAIVLKALEKNKEQRYQSVDSFCSDLQRYLAGEPISAKPASSIYLIRKAIRKHRSGVAITVMLLLGAAASLIIFKSVSARIKETEGKLAQQLEQNKKKDQEISTLQSGLTPEQKGLEQLLSKMDPNLRKSLEGLSTGVETGDIPVSVFKSLGERLAASGGKQPEDKSPTKKIGVDLDTPMSLPLKGNEAGKAPVSREAMEQALTILLSTMYQQKAAQDKATSKPSTQPSASPLPKKPKPPPEVFPMHWHTPDSFGGIGPAFK